MGPHFNVVFSNLNFVMTWAYLLCVSHSIYHPVRCSVARLMQVYV